MRQLAGGAISNVTVSSSANMAEGAITVAEGLRGMVRSAALDDAGDGVRLNALHARDGECSNLRHSLLTLTERLAFADLPIPFSSVGDDIQQPGHTTLLLEEGCQHDQRRPQFT